MTEAPPIYDTSVSRETLPTFTPQNDLATCDDCGIAYLHRPTVVVRQHTGRTRVICQDCHDATTTAFQAAWF